MSLTQVVSSGRIYLPKLLQLTRDNGFMKLLVLGKIGSLLLLTKQHFAYRISSYSFRGNYSFLNLTLCTVTFGNSTYRCGNYSREETIQGRKLYEEMRYSIFERFWGATNKDVLLLETIFGQNYRKLPLWIKVKQSEKNVKIQDRDRTNVNLECAFFPCNITMQCPIAQFFSYSFSYLDNVSCYQMRKLVMTIMTIVFH